MTPRHLFKLPEKISNAWLQVINRPDWVPTKKTKICSRHFSANDIVSGRYLRLGAIPKPTVLPGKMGVHIKQCIYFLWGGGSGGSKKMFTEHYLIKKFEPLKQDTHTKKIKN